MIKTFALLTILALVVAGCLACGSGNDSRTATPTSVPATSTSAPSVAAGNWTISGELVGSMDMQASACQMGPPAGYKWGAQLTGTLNGTVIAIFFASSIGGTLDLSLPSIDTLVSVRYGAADAVEEAWFGLAGSPGMSGSVTVESNGSASMDATLPPSYVATQPITISGQWTCP
jgi:hypothetical protein